MKHAEKFFDGHPSDEQLDRLRAELYDDAPAVRDALAAHLAACAQCRARGAIWRDTAAILASAAAPTLAGALRARRRDALAGRPARRAAMPRMAFALAATLAAVVIGTGLFFYVDTGDDAVTTASNEQADIYADLDFYLWLLHEQNGDDSESSS